MACSVCIVTYEESGRLCQEPICEGVRELDKGKVGSWREFLLNLTVLLQIHPPNAPQDNFSPELACLVYVFLPRKSFSLQGRKTFLFSHDNN